MTKELKASLSTIAAEFVQAHAPHEGLCVNVLCGLTTITGHRVWEVSLLHAGHETLIVQFGEAERTLAHQAQRYLEARLIASYNALMRMHPADLLAFAAPDAPASEPSDAPDSLDALYDAESEANQ